MSKQSRYGTAKERAPESPELLTTDQFCRRLQIHPVTAIVWRREGKGPPFIDAPDVRFIRYPLKSVETWEKRGLKCPHPDSNDRSKTRARAKALTLEQIELDCADYGIGASTNPTREDMCHGRS